MDWGGAAAGVNRAMAQEDAQAIQRFQLQQMRQLAAQQQAARNAQAAAQDAYRKTMMSVYGAPPMPGQPSVPMVHPSAQAPMGVPAATAPAAPRPYRTVAQAAAARAGTTGAPAMPSAPLGPTPATFQLPPRPPRPQLNMQAVMANAPADPQAFDMYMQRMTPMLNAQDKALMQQQKFELQVNQAQNKILMDEVRIANASTPEERKAALAERVRHDQVLEGLMQQGFGLRKQAADEKQAKAAAARSMSEASRKMAISLVQQLQQLVALHPDVVGIRGSLSRGEEAVGGMFGGTSSYAHDFAQKVRALQNIVKKVEPYGPKGRVLKGEMADRDQIVEGLGAWTSAANAQSGFSTLLGWLNRAGAGAPQTATEAVTATAPTAPVAAGQTQAPPAAVAYLKANNTPQNRKFFQQKYGYLP